MEDEKKHTKRIKNKGFTSFFLLRIIYFYFIFIGRPLIFIPRAFGPSKSSLMLILILILILQVYIYVRVCRISFYLCIQRMTIACC